MSSLAFCSLLKPRTGNLNLRHEEDEEARTETPFGGPHNRLDWLVANMAEAHLETAPCGV